MRKILPRLIAGLSILAVIAYFFVNANRENRYPEVTFPLLNEAETGWYNAGIIDYRLVVEVEFSTERRRHTSIIQKGQITEATLSYWDGDAWTTPEPINMELAAEYTIAGLFNTLRLELNQNIREELRMDINEDPTYPQYIYFGPVGLDGELMEESEARFTVIEFESLKVP